MCAIGCRRFTKIESWLFESNSIPKDFNVDMKEVHLESMDRPRQAEKESTQRRKKGEEGKSPKVPRNKEKIEVGRNVYNDERRRRIWTIHRPQINNRTRPPISGPCSCTEEQPQPSLGLFLSPGSVLGGVRFSG